MRHAILRRTNKQSTAARRSVVWIGLLIVWSLSGCRQPTYQAANLPAEYHAKAVEDLELFDFSRLSVVAVSNEMIDIGDVLDVTVTSVSNEGRIEAPVRVGEDGMALVPPIGMVRLAGLEFTEAEQAIAAEAIRLQLYRHPFVTVSMKRQRVNQVTVIGPVEKPGVYQLPRGQSSLLAALVKSGGLTPEATPNIRIRRPGRLLPGSALPGRGGPGSSGPNVASGNSISLAGYTMPVSQPARTFEVNLIDAGARSTGGMNLEDGDVVMVMKQDSNPLHVIGLVREPGQFEITPSKPLYVLDALALAGGRTLQVADKVLVTRRTGTDARPIVIEVSVKEAKHDGKANLRLAPGDLVSVEETPATVIVDSLRSFLRIGVNPLTAF